MKRRLRIAGWALGLSLAMAGIGAAVGASQGAPVEAGAVNNDTEYALINSTDDLETGKSYMITNGTEGTVKTMIKTANTNNRRTTEVTVDETTHRITRGANALSVTLEEKESVLHFKTDNYGGTAGYFASADAGTNSNYLLVSATAGAVTISFSGDAAVINVGPHASRKILRYNAGSGSTPTPLFSCYSSGQAAVYLWKEVEVETGVATGVQITTTGTPYVGETLALTGTVSYQAKEADHRVTWSVESGDATVNESGVVTVGTAESVIKALAEDKGAGGVDVYATYTVTPVANPITNVAFDTTGAKKAYLTGDSLDISGVVATATYTSGNTRPYALKAADFSGFDSSEPVASQTITINVIADEHNYSTSYSISVSTLPALKFGTDYNKITAVSQNLTDEYDRGWAFAADFGSQTKSFSTSADYAQIGAGSSSGKWVSTVSFTRDFGETPYTFKSFSIKLSGFDGTTGNVSVTVDGVEKANGTLNGTDVVTVSLPQAARGCVLVVNMTNLNRLKVHDISYSASTDAECVTSFVNRYMYMDDYAENLGYCKDVSHHYYADAKAAFNALFPEQRSLFASEDTYAAARARLQNWAAANGDVFDVNNTLVKAYQGTFGGLTNNDPTAIAVAGLVGGMLLATGIGVLVIRRKKQK